MSALLPMTPTGLKHVKLVTDRLLGNECADLTARQQKHSALCFTSSDINLLHAVSD